MFARYQKGLSPIGVLLVVCIFMFFVVCGLKLTPHYLDFGTLKMIYADINNNQDIGNRTPNEVYETIRKALSMNALDDFDIKANTVLNKESGQMQIGLDYEVREPLFGNISVVLTFQYFPE